MRSPSTPALTSLYRKLFRAFGAQNWWPGDTPFEVSVGAILTQNTNWVNVEKAIENLKSEKALSAKAIHSMPIDRLAELIRPSGYFNVKAKRLKAFINYIVEFYDGNILKMKKEDTEHLRKRLLNIHGIGQETADSILLYALDKPVFVIDAYTKRILSRHGILKYEDTYEKFQILFHSSIKKDVQLYNEYHALLVMVGKHYCKPKPRCEGCPARA